MKREISRKAFHLATVLAPLLVWVLPRRVSLPLLLGGAALWLSIDLARLYIRPVRHLFLRLTRTMLRHHERRGLTGGTYMIVSYAAALLLFPKGVAVAAMLFNGLGDAAAALVGKRWGRHRTSWGKSWEGFAAALVVCLVSGLAVARLDPALAPAGALLGALVAAAAEFAPLPLDDNVRVTLGGGAAAWLGTVLVAG